MAQSFADLPLYKTGTQTYQYSSTDPKEDQFKDFGNWLYTAPDSGAVLADIKGPGTIYRIWSTGNIGDTNRIKIYIDGEKTPRINQTFNQFHNKKPLRDKPQVGSGAGDNYLAWWSYMPISFRKSIKIVREGNFRPFYNIAYHTYTTADGIESWTGKEDYRPMEKMWNNPTADPKPAVGNISKKLKQKLAAGDSASIFSYNGAGYIAAIKIKNYTPDKNLRIKMYWDNQAVPAVDAPLKWFFGSIDNGGDLKALGVGTVNNNGYCYFPMPFWKRARIELVNMGDKPTGDMDIEVQYNKKAYPAASAAYFHAKANEVDKPGQKYTCLKTTGRGHVIGMAKRMPKGGHACEGDEVFYIDNRKFPDIWGTGEEDYANNAWWRNKYNSYPTHGCIGNDCYYRMHYPDVITYEQAFDMEFESWENYYIASLVWYYEGAQPSLKQTDSVDIGNSVSEQKHQYRITGQTWAGETSGNYPGKRIYDVKETNSGKQFNKSSAFTIAINKNNKGVRLRLLTQHTNMQGVRVWVDGKPVTERPWVIVKNNYEAVWIDTDFEIPAAYTRGKSKINIKLEHLPGYANWTEYKYNAFSYL
ncbi:DUF2961 domain-containing protein [Mucilaginibacter terrigena]|uniref:DUF2961 domain-containing protein n=1 Tax=Mucilaginibacter terrigena TaxID=2492395 RepID=A0A4Q5LPB0_9SPHI|nr:DUF2961 domain-containing protein [Mucilaginibacter terrigena]RYU91231.1 DUF2961 domain-containing protein [Mucilaginibacter terrigena]